MALTSSTSITAPTMVPMDRSAFMLGVFVSLDFFLFYVFWEVMTEREIAAVAQYAAGLR